MGNGGSFALNFGSVCERPHLILSGFDGSSPARFMRGGFLRLRAVYGVFCVVAASIVSHHTNSARRSGPAGPASHNERRA